MLAFPVSLLRPVLLRVPSHGHSRHAESGQRGSSVPLDDADVSAVALCGATRARASIIGIHGSDTHGSVRASTRGQPTVVHQETPETVAGHPHVPVMAVRVVETL